MPKSRKLLGTILMEMGIINQGQLDEALMIQKENPVRIGELLVELEYATPRQITEALSEQFDMTLVDLRGMQIPVDLTELVPMSLAKEHKIIPVAVNCTLWLILRTNPKSTNSARPVAASMRMLAGFTSRWINPAL